MCACVYVHKEPVRSIIIPCRREYYIAYPQNVTTKVYQNTSAYEVCQQWHLTLETM